MKYLLLIILMVAVVITAGCVKPEPRFYPNPEITPAPTSAECKYSTCNGICYYNGSQTCCGGRLYDSGQCCGGIIHDVNKDPGTCCGGKWVVSGTKGECCPNPEFVEYFQVWQDYEQVWINTSIQHCCAGKVAAGGVKTGMKPPSYYSTGVWSDCGNTCYDSSSQSCCSDQGGWTTYDIRLWSPASYYNLKVYEGVNRCCTHGVIKLCPEGMKCCYKGLSQNAEPTCEDLKSWDCDTSGFHGGSGNTIIIPLL